MKSIAITGTIGSGKSACSQLLRKKGFQVFDCDQVCHSYLLKDGCLYNQVIHLLTDKILKADGEIDRSKVAALIFSDHELKKQYEFMFHQQLKIDLFEQMSCCQDLFFAEVPLLFETEFDKLFDESWLVVCDEQIAIERCMKYRQMTLSDITSRIRSQMHVDLKKARADVIIENNHTLDELERQIDQLLERMNAYATMCKE